MFKEIANDRVEIEGELLWLVLKALDNRQVTFIQQI